MSSLFLAMAIFTPAIQQAGPSPEVLEIIAKGQAATRPQTPEKTAEMTAGRAAMIACQRAFMGQDYMPNPMIWKVADADTTIYLFGTIHQLPPSFDWRSPQLEQIIHEARLLITETGLRENSGDSRSLVDLMTDAAPPQPPIVKRVKGKQRAKWLGMSAMLPENQTAMLDRLPSWIAAVYVGLAAQQMKTPPMGTGADHQLKQAFREAKKPVVAIEDGDAVVAAVSRIPEPQQRRMLREALDAVGRPITLGERMAMYHQWARGEYKLDALWTKGKQPFYVQALRQPLLTARNAAWAAELVRRMAEPGVTLVAVGAGHLDGTDSLLALLAKRGFRAELVSSTSPPVRRAEFLPKPANWSECSTYLFGKKVPQAGVK
ncbi:MAG: TraB/GumN family protein [Pseudomonadota bacterium]|nr:TraB/GumN family protein [Pseudomonadota bacterium]